MNRLAVIDLGSNTFHLLIVDAADDHSFSTVYRMRVFVGLSEGGVQIIKEDRIRFGLDTLRQFKSVLDEYHVSRLRVVGTAILREASNRAVFITSAAEILDCPIEIIDGNKEADYIFMGITLLEPLRYGTHLIMDVGGGSTEFIVIKDGEKLWSKSYLLGVGVLHQLFHKSEPIAPENYQQLENHVMDTLHELMAVISLHKPDTLAGASGSFEVLESMTGLPIESNKHTEIEPSRFYALADKIIHSDERERHKMPGLPVERVKLIVVGMALKKIVCTILQPQKILVSPYALKEGVLREMISEHP